ncbi:MAG TPA: aldehyde dehydrogenase family protein [Anaerolineae bacterium]|nr:aldehyde dehydrogenase family protein [Anaerolineae bacterium]
MKNTVNKPPQLNHDQVEAIVAQVMRQLSSPSPTPTTCGCATPSCACTTPSTLTPPSPGHDGIFTTLDEAITAAEIAFRHFSALPLAQRQTIINQMRLTSQQHAAQLAQLALDESGMGRLDDKISKNLLAATKTPGPEILSATSWSGDNGLTLVEFAPYGLIGALTPSTNPTSTIICNSIGMVAAGNAVVFNAHPTTKTATNTTIQLLNRAIQTAGGPPNLLTAIAHPTLESATTLMHHPAIRLLVVTGGAAVVRAAMSSGKRAICAGPGNPPVIVDETASIDQAARDIVHGGSFDNNIVCTTEKETFAVASICDKLLQAMPAHGALHLPSWQFNRLWRAVTTKDRGPNQPADMNKNFIGKDAHHLLATIGINAGPEIRQIVAEVPADHPAVWTEQMMPLMPVVRVPHTQRAIELAVAAEHGYRHTAIMHSKHLDNLSTMARTINCSIFVKNGPNIAGLGAGGEGFCSLTIASPTGEGLTEPRSFSRIRRCTLVDAFRIV